VSERAGESPAQGGPVQLGLCLAALSPLGLAGAAASAAEAGADIVDLPADRCFGLVDADRLSDPEQHRRTAATLRGAGVRAGCVSNSRDTQLVLGPHGPHTDPVLGGSAADKRAYGQRAALGTVALAAGVGAPLARLMLGVPDLAGWLSWWGSEVSWRDNVAAWLEAAAPALALARESGVRVVVEPHPKQVAYDPASTRALLDAAPEVGLCLDVANLAAVGHDPVLAARGWGDRLAAVHAKDLQVWRRSEDPRGAGWSRYGPGPSIRFRTLGCGELPWAEIVASLLDEAYQGVIYVEHEDALLPAGQGIATSVTALRTLLPAGKPQGRTW
jgi:sugar phosphate isomerase/epimerase